MTSGVMLKLSIKSVAAHRFRLFLTILSVILGTSFVAGSFIFTDTLSQTYDKIMGNVAQGVDVRLSPHSAGTIGIPRSAVKKLRSLPGVENVVPAQTGSVVLLNAHGEPMQAGQGAQSTGSAYLNPKIGVGQPITIVNGSAPTRQGDIIINQAAADRGDLRVGSHTKLVTAATPQGLPVTVSGIYTINGVTDTGGIIDVKLFPADASEQFTDGRHYSYIDVVGVKNAAGKVDDAILAARIQEAFPSDKVQTGPEVNDEAKASVKQQLSFLQYFLLAFGAIGLIAGTFIIYNTFSMIVAQRLRELALLRAIGASRSQIRNSVIVEALIVGMLGSVLGLGVGYLLAMAIRWVTNTVGGGFPNSPFTLTPLTVVLVFTVGVLVTVVSAYVPADRAAKVPPVAAMRAEFSAPKSSLVVRGIVGFVVAAVGSALVMFGAATGDTEGAIIAGVGAFMVILAVLVGAPAVIIPTMKVLGVITIPFGSLGRLAKKNAIRSPRRTAATAFALCLGLALVAMVATLGASATKSVTGLVDTDLKSDFVLKPPLGMTMPVQAGQTAATVSGVKSVGQLRIALAAIVPRGTMLKSIPSDSVGLSSTGTIDDMYRMDTLHGSLYLPADSSNVLISSVFAERHKLSVGSPVTVISAGLQRFPATVTGIYQANHTAKDWIISDKLYKDVTPQRLRSDDTDFVIAAPGADLSVVHKNLNDALKKYYTVRVLNKTEFKGQISEQVDQLMTVLYALLALAVVIAILGIINTLALSVVERRKEIGMLRAIGLARRQLRATIYIESVLISLFGASLGLAMGAFFGWGFVKALRNKGLGTIEIPWPMLLIVLAAASVVGVLAAVLPAAQASKTSPLEAISEA